MGNKESADHCFVLRSLAHYRLPNILTLLCFYFCYFAIVAFIRFFFSSFSKFPIGFPHKRHLPRSTLSLPLPTHSHTCTHFASLPHHDETTQFRAACSIELIITLCFSPISLRVATDGRRPIDLLARTFRNIARLLRKYLRERGAMRSLQLVCPIPCVD